MLKLLRKKMAESGIKILAERQSITPELVVSHLPQSYRSNRRKVCRLSPFTIKSPDIGKHPNSTNALEEARNEVVSCLEFPYSTTQKVAILHLERFNTMDIFLVEEEIEPYSEARWKELNLVAETELLMSKIKEEGWIGDFKNDNVGYDAKEKKIKFFDVAPYKKSQNIGVGVEPAS